MKAKSWLKLFLVLAVCGCADNRFSSISLVGLNYTEKGITWFTVDDAGGASISPRSGGGKFVCCLSVPKRWRPDLTVTVRWSEEGGAPDNSRVRVVQVPKYSEQDLGFFAVHFYPNDEVKVLVTVIAEGHPHYPFPRLK